MKHRERTISNGIFVLIYMGVFVIAFSVNAILAQVFSWDLQYYHLAIAISVTMFIFILENSMTIGYYSREHEHLKNDLELRDILYKLLQKTSSLDETDILYQDILMSAIAAIPNGEKGSIINISDGEKVHFEAAVGFDYEVLSQMTLDVENTYLYKETKGGMNRTVIIRDSLRYNHEHENDPILKELVDAGTLGISSTICTPIRVNNQVIGMINVDSSMPDAFTDEDVRSIELFAFEVGKMIRYRKVLADNLYLSRYDSMTGIYNRAYFESIQKDFHKKNRSYTYVTTDINNLKVINDTYGHPVGDRFILHFTKTVSRNLNKDVIFARYGGDEFNFIFPGSSPGYANQVMEELSEQLEDEPIFVGEDPIFVMFSFGIASYPQDEKDMDRLITIADKKMYEHKYKSRKEKRESAKEAIMLWDDQKK